MPRGLSGFQCKILKLALRNGGRVASRDVLIEIYQFPTVIDHKTAKNGVQVFNRQAIGLKRYQCASVAACKSLNRLCERGLGRRLYGHEQGIELSQDGLRVAKSLRVGTIGQV